MSKHQADSPDVLDAASIGTLVESFKPQSPGAERKAAMRRHLLQRIESEPLPGLQTQRANSGRWISVSPLIEVKVLSRNDAENTQIALWRLQPGAVIAAHDHAVTEECLVLEGSLSMGEHTVYAGDFHVAAAGSRHPDLTSVDGALLYIRAEIPRRSASAVS